MQTVWAECTQLKHQNHGHSDFHTLRESNFSYPLGRWAHRPLTFRDFLSVTSYHVSLLVLSFSLSLGQQGQYFLNNSTTFKVLTAKKKIGIRFSSTPPPPPTNTHNNNNINARLTPGRASCSPHVVGKWYTFTQLTQNTAWDLSDAIICEIDTERGEPYDFHIEDRQARSRRQILGCHPQRQLSYFNWVLCQTFIRVFWTTNWLVYFHKCGRQEQSSTDRFAE